MEALSSAVRVPMDALQRAPQGAAGAAAAERTTGGPEAAQSLRQQAGDAQKEAPRKDENLEDAVNSANYFFEQVSRELRFQRSEAGGELVIQVVDQKTGDVIRQIPSEEMLKISRQLEKISGLLFKDNA